VFHSRIRSALAGLVLTLALPQLASAATLEEMAGQMIIVGFQGDGPKDASVTALRDEIAAGRIGGVMYLKLNVKSLDAVAAMNAQFKAASPDLPPFITLDQEGGAVERLTETVGFKEIPRAVVIAAENDPAGAEKIYGEMADSVAKLGFTVNFGPVVDLDLNPDNQIIAKYGRSFSKDPETVVAYADAFVKAHRAAGLLTALKHFPGHGSSTADSHEGFVDITNTWKEEELEPYKRFVAQGYDEFVMVGHLIHEDYSGTGAPSSLSPEWIDGVLRKDLGFGGVVISDDLEMGAIREHFTLEQTVTRAVRAGMDVLLFSNTADYRASLGKEILDILVTEGEKDPEFAKRIAASYERILALKKKLP